jgi:hypothetical protein
MKGDFSRNTFDPNKHFARVLMQQGRVQLDADWNEQAAILLHHLQTLAWDLIGPHGGPASALGFGITSNGVYDFEISPRRYYVDGILCENEVVLDADGNPLPLLYTRQPDYPNAPELKDGATYLVYLDVWERHITYIQDESIREVALGGPDTATRAKVVWQVKAEESDNTACPDGAVWDKLVNRWQARNRGLLKARAKEPQDADSADPSVARPYRGTENQLYRVEVHRSGAAGEATFKWSRENGSVVFPIRMSAGMTATVGNLGRDSRWGLEIGAWVEMVDDEDVLGGHPGPLVQVNTIEQQEMRVTLKPPMGGTSRDYKEDDPRHPLLRRWDHARGNPTEGAPQIADDGALVIQEDEWLSLENGVQVLFESASSDKGSGSEESHFYRTGDYWLLPARTVTGDVEWPSHANDAKDPKAVPPHGVEHHYAPLAIVAVNRREINVVGDCRCRFEPPCPPRTFESKTSNLI